MEKDKTFFGETVIFSENAFHYDQVDLIISKTEKLSKEKEKYVEEAIKMQSLKGSSWKETKLRKNGMNEVREYLEIMKDISLSV